MRPRLHHLIFSGAILSIGSLLLYSRLADQRKASDFQVHSERVAGRMCQVLQDIEIQLLGRAASPIPPHPPVIPSAQAVFRSGGTGSIQLKCPRLHPSLPLRMEALRRPSEPLLFSVEKGEDPQGDSVVLSRSQLLREDDGGVKIRRLTPWASSTARSIEGGHLYLISFGEMQFALGLAPERSWAEQVERGLVFGLGGLGVMLSVLIGSMTRPCRWDDQRLGRSPRNDGQTSLLTNLALASDLEACPGRLSGAQPRMAMLVTISFRFLERQRPFLSASEIATIITTACEDIQHVAPTYSGMDCYRTGETKVGLIITASSHNTLLSKQDCESLLSQLLEIVCASTRQSSSDMMDWDDVVITGQRFELGESPSSVLSMQSIGEMLASEDSRRFRLIETGDDKLLRERGQVKVQLAQLKAEDLDLLFQPILLVPNPGQFALELLVRFRPKALNDLGTERVFTLAHDLGIAHRIDFLVISRLEEVRLALRRSEVLRNRIDYISVNISGDSACSEERLNQLISLLKKHRVDSSIFSIEITETAVTDNLNGPASVTSASERLIKELNFRILIDDFGSGLSNYRRVSEAWYDAIKLDINLVKDIDRSFRLQRYVGSLINTVHALGKTVVCEGIETYNEMTAAVRLGADALQGYLISRPLCLEAVTAFLETSEWASPDSLRRLLATIHSTSRLLGAGTDQEGDRKEIHLPLERYILDNWSRLRSFEEFVLLFVNELKIWGLDILRFSLAFLPDQDDIDCSQYIWQRSSPGDVTTLRFERDFLQHKEHLHSPLHYIATANRVFRQKPSTSRGAGFEFLEALKAEGCSDYLGIRLDSRGVSIPVLTIALFGESAFSDEQIERIEAMSSLLSLLFYAFESERSKRLALLDSLTMLANRRSFDSFLRSNIASAMLSASDLSLAFIDIDQFKAINDELGHGYGDHCLKKIALLLNATIHRKSDFVARLGGEEFAIILPNTNAQSAFGLCERLRESIEQQAIYHPDPLKGNRLTVSIGIAVWESGSHAACDFDLLQQVADECLYEAKRNGRNKVICRSLARNSGVAA